MTCLILEFILICIYSQPVYLFVEAGSYRCSPNTNNGGASDIGLMLVSSLMFSLTGNDETQCALLDSTSSAQVGGRNKNLIVVDKIKAEQGDHISWKYCFRHNQSKKRIKSWNHCRRGRPSMWPSTMATAAESRLICFGFQNTSSNILRTAMFGVWSKKLWSGLDSRGFARLVDSPVPAAWQILDQCSKLAQASSLKINWD